MVTTRYATVIPALRAGISSPPLRELPSHTKRKEDKQPVCNSLPPAFEPPRVGGCMGEAGCMLKSKRLGLEVELSRQGTCAARTKPWIRSPAPRKLSTVTEANDPSTREIETGSSEGQIHSWLHRKVNSSLVYVSNPFLKINSFTKRFLHSGCG